LTRAIEILRELVAIPSVSAMSNRPVMEAAVRLLVASGWEARLLSYQDSHNVEKVNLIARPLGQSSDSIDLAFVCHTDTVPFDLAAWPDATTLTERDDMLHGCGSCDVKGSLAAILAAIAQTPVSEIRRDVALILTADEEIGCIGATKLLATEKLRVKQVLVCEPTSLRPAIAGKGYGLAEVVVTGAEAHSAFPRQGRSAIYAAASIIKMIETASFTATFNHLFDPPLTTFNVGTIRGGTAKNIIPGECRFLVEWRPLPEDSPADGIAWLNQLASEAAKTHPGCDVSIKVTRADKGFAYDAESPFVSGLAEQLGTEPMGISFGSEATRFARVADEVVVLGPGNMHTAHSDRECIPMDELEAFVECVGGLLRADR
jgi:acetylornithine deacetylase